MREILFRGKRIDNGEWVYGTPIYDGETVYILSGVIEANEEYICIEVWNPVIPETIGQYTGLTDKNGAKIFEGNIVKTHFSFKHNVEQEPFIITWNKDKAMFEGVKPEKNKDDYLRRFSFFPGQEFIYEVIGNIHDNPEMMEELDE